MKARTSIQLWSAGLMGMASCLLAPAPAQAQDTRWSVLIGTLCIDGLPNSGRRPRGETTNNGVVVDEFDVTYDSSGTARRPVIRIFQAPPNPDPLSRCGELRDPVLLEGEVRQLRLTGARQVRPGTGPALIELPAGGLDVDFVGTHSNLPPLYGGRLQLGREGGISPSARSWVRNPTALRASAGQPTIGALDIESWGRRLENAQVTLPGSNETVSATMSAGNANIIVRVQANGTAFELRRGTFASDPIVIRSAALALPGIQLGSVEGRGRLRLEAGDDAVRLTLADLDYRAASGRFATRRTALETGAQTGRIEAIGGEVPRAAPTLAPQAIAVTNHRLQARNCGYTVGSALLTRADQCTLDIARSVADARSWVFLARTPGNLLGDFALARASEIRLMAQESPAGEALGGEVAAPRVRLGALRLEPQALRLERSNLGDSQIRLPFALNLPPAGGAWSFETGEGRAILEGRLSRLEARGHFVLDLANPSAWAIEMPTGTLGFDGRISTVLLPHLYNGRPQYGAASLAFASVTPVRASAAGVTGTLRTQAETLVMLDAEFALGEQAQGMFLRGPARFAAAVSLDYDLASARARINAGELDLQNVVLFTRPGQSGDVGDIRLTDGHAGFERLRARFANGQGEIELTGGSLVAGRIETRPAGTGGRMADQLVISGRPSGAQTLTRLAGVVAQDERGALALADLDLGGLAIDVADARLGAGRQLRLAAERVTARIDRLTPTVINASLSLRNGRLAAQVDESEARLTIASFDLNLTGGTPLAPYGTGRLLTGPIDIRQVQQMVIRESCEDGNPFKTLGVRSHIQAPAVIMALTLRNGDLRGQGISLLTSAELNSVGTYSCRASVIDWPIVREQRAYYDYPCPTTRKPFRMCDGWTVIVPEVRVRFDRILNIRRLYASGFFTTVEFQIQADASGEVGVQACGRGGALTPLVDMNYVITPRTGIPVVNSIIEDIIDHTSRPFESLLFTALGNLGGTLMPNFGQGLCV